MSKTKCRKCGLVTFTPELVCARCASYIGPKTTRLGPREAAKRSSMLYTLLFLAIVLYGANHFYQGVKTTMAEMEANTAKYAREVPPTPVPANRAENDNRRTDAYKTAIKKNLGLTEHERRLAETQELTRGGSPAKASSNN